MKAGGVIRQIKSKSRLVAQLVKCLPPKSQDLSSNQHKRLGMEVWAYNSSAGELETNGSPGPVNLVYQTLSQKMTLEVVLCPPHRQTERHTHLHIHKKFSVILWYIVSSRLAWDTWNPVSKKKKKGHKTMFRAYGTVAQRGKASEGTSTLWFQNPWWKRRRHL